MVNIAQSGIFIGLQSARVELRLHSFIGRSAVVRITDRGPFVSGRIIDVSQIAAYELGFSDLMKVCLKILSIPENRPGGEY